jgi:hypothetical protein
MLQLAMVIVYYSLHHHQDDDPSVDSTDSHHPQASLNATASQVVSLIMTRALQVEEGDSDGDSKGNTSDDRALEIIVFEALLVLRAVLFPRNIFLISGLATKRRKLKIALRRCILGDYNVDLSP